MPKKDKYNKKGKTFNLRREVQDKTPEKHLNANQFVATEQQLQWLDNYMNPKSPTVGNAYQSAISAGYSESYARQISSTNAPQWVEDSKFIRRSLKTDHLVNITEEIALNAFAKDSDRLKAVQMLGAKDGLFVEKKVVGLVGLEQALRDLE